MGRRRDGERVYATTHCWEVEDLAKPWREAWPKVLDLLDRYTAGDDAAGKYLATHLYGSPHHVPIPQVFPEFGFLRNRVSPHDSGVWGILVNGAIYPCYAEPVEDRILTLADVVKDNAAAERLFLFWHRLTDIAIFIRETSPKLDIGGVTQRTFVEYFKTDMIENMITLMSLYYPALATVKKAYEKYARNKRAGRSSDIGTIWRDLPGVPDRPSGFGDQPLGFVDDIKQSIKDIIEPILREVKDWITSAVDAITDGIRGLIADAVDTVAEFIRDIAQPIGELVDGAIGYIRDVYDSVIATVERFIEETVTAMQAAFDTAIQYVSDLVREVADWFSSVADTLSQEISEVFDGIETFFDDVGAQLSALLDPIIGEAQSIAAGALELVESVPKALSDGFDRMVEFASELPEKYGEAFKAAMVNPLLLQIISEDDNASAAGEAQIVTMLETAGIEARTAADMAKQIASVAPTAPIPRRLFLGIATLFLIWQALAAPVAIASERAKQAASLALPHRIMQDADLLVSIVRGLKPEDEALRELRSTGYSEDDARRLVTMRRQLVPAGEMLVWWLRGLLSDDDLHDQLALQALAPEDQERLKQAAFFIPPPQDLITMAVREVFSPETAEKFGQFEDFPADFAKYARMQGISEDWARNYWAAHWGLPSPQMGFDMFQRAIISEDELKMLMKALDIMPFWRDRLIKLSYSPLTRVDIRRMHKVGVLDEAQIRRAYLDIGYSPDNADRLTKFTIELNKPKRADDDDELLALSKGQIVTAFREGILSQERAHALLVGLDMSGEAADVLLELADLDRERDERKSEIAFVQDQFKAGLIPMNEAASLIASLGLATIEQSRAIAQLQRLERARTKLPSKADLDKFWIADIINDAEYLRQLDLLGYPEVWAQRYLTLLDRSEDDNA